MLLVELHDFDTDPKQSAAAFVRQRAAAFNQQRRRPSYDDEPASYVELHFYQPDSDGMPNEDSELTVVGFEVSYDVSPDEYDGPHLFARGEVNADWKVAEPFVWNGQQLNKLVPQMAPCCDELEGLGIDAFEAGDARKCMELLDQAVERQLDLDSVSVPQKRYPDSRSF
jgi:hypothetical protein